VTIASYDLVCGWTMTSCPLTSVRVLDLSRVLAGPVCCQVLADLGADVVKVERPGVGDDTRQWGPPFVGEADVVSRGGAADAAQRGPSAYYLSANRGKRGLALDLDHSDGRVVLDDLIRRADVLVENFLPHSLDKLGLRPERLRELNPELVSAAISGFGRSGPLADTPGYDLVIQATSGVMSITGEPQGMPMKVGVAITDVLTGLYAAIGVLAGLFARGRGAPGISLDLALADCTLASLVNVAQSALLTGQRPTRFGNAHPNIVPYEAFATADGHLVLAVGNDRQWQRFCVAASSLTVGVSTSDLASDERFRTNPLRVKHRRELIGLLALILRQRTTAQWQPLLTAAEVPHAAVQALDEILTSPQVAARNMTHVVSDAAGRRYKLLGSPIHWYDQPPSTVTPPPDLGQHTDEVLRDWLGYDPARIAALRASGAVA
jgi:formyl-CoA transferase